MAITAKPAGSEYPLNELIKARWSPRAFSNEAVGAGELQLLMEAARWAPSSGNVQPWFFIVAQKQNPEEFAQALACLKPANQRWAGNAPVLLFAVARSTYENEDKINRHAAYDLGQSMAYLTIEAISRGLFVHQMAGILPEAVKAAYGVPGDYEVLTGAAIGHLGKLETLSEDLQKREVAARTRKPLNSFVFSGKWGHAAPFLDDLK